MQMHATFSAGKPPPWRIRDLVLVGASIIALMIGLDALLIIIDVEGLLLSDFKHKSLVTLGLFLAQEVLFLLPLYVFVIRRYHLHMDQLGIRTVSIKSAALLILKGFGMFVVFNIVLIIVLAQLGLETLPGFKEQTPYLPLFGESALDSLIAALVLIGIAPLIEEVLFRGFLLETFLHRMRPIFASIVTAGIFSIVHFQFQNIGTIFVLALILNHMYMRSRSILPCVGFHMVNNTIAFMLEMFVK